MHEQRATKKEVGGSCDGLNSGHGGNPEAESIDTRIEHRMTRMTSTTTATTTTRRRRRRQHGLPSHRQATGDIEANVDIVCTKSHTDDIAAAQYAQE